MSELLSLPRYGFNEMISKYLFRFSENNMEDIVRFCGIFFRSLEKKRQEARVRSSIELLPGVLGVSDEESYTYVAKYGTVKRTSLLFSPELTEAPSK